MASPEPERIFAENFRVNGEEPSVAVCGVDNVLARAALEEPGFGRVIEAGLGRGPREYLDFQVHTFPARKSAKERWGGLGREEPTGSALLAKPAYKALAEEGLDECGLVTVAAARWARRSSGPSPRRWSWPSSCAWFPEIGGKKR